MIERLKSALGVPGNERFAALVDALATRLELSREGDHWDAVELAGRHRGARVQVEVSAACTVRIAVNVAEPLPPGLMVEPPGDAVSPPSARVEVGDEVLDARVDISCANPAAALRLLRSPELRAPLLRFTAHGGARLSHGWLRLGPLESPAVDEVREHVKEMCALAALLASLMAELNAAHAAEVARTHQGEPPVLEGRRFIALPPVLDPEREIRRTFQRRRRWLVRGVVPGFLVALGASVTFGAGTAAAWALLMAVAGCLGLWELWWRCPACKRGLRLLAAFSPAVCGHCGARLE